MSKANKNQGQKKIVIERTYRADIQDVWDLWTTKEGFESWWGPQGFRAEVEVIEPREGGALRYEMIAATPEMIDAMRQAGRPPSHPTSARFTALRPLEHLVMTSVIDFIPEVAVYESVITVDFSAAGDTVRMVVTLDPMHSEEFSQMQKEGFTSQLTKLDERFA